MELLRDFYVGTVEDNKDPNRKGRIKVRVQTLYHNLAVEDIPYAYPFAGLAGKEFQVPAIGKLVNILFLSDDLYSPYYIYSENYNANLQNKLKSLTDEEYANFSALLFDESTQIFIKGTEFTMDQLLNKITINNNSINHELKDNTQILNLGSKGANQDAVLGTNFFKWMDRFIDELGKTQSMFDSNGSPILKTKLDILCKEYKSLRPNFVSKNVKIVDNGQVKILSRTPDTINNKNDIDLILDMADQMDQCQEYKEQESQEIANLYKAIQEQNDKACETLSNAAPTPDIPLNVEGEELSNKKGKTGRKNQKFIDDLHPKIRPYVIRLINQIESELNTRITISSGYRSLQDQQDLYEKKLKGEIKQVVARPGRSFHEYGLAVDIFPEYKGKLITIATQDNYPFWDRIGYIGESLGFRWGKYFSYKENWHFDMGFGYNSEQLLNKTVNGDLIEEGFVNLDGTNYKPTNNQYNGQDYSTTNRNISINQPCENSKKFNSGQRQRGDNGQSDEGEALNVTPINSTLNCNEKNAKILLDQIAKGEGTTIEKAMSLENVNSEYDITYAYGKYTPERLPNGKPVQPISSLTIGEIKEVQRLMKQNQQGNKNISSAIGKYQFIENTLTELANKAGLSDDTVFTSDVQDKLAIQKLKGRGYDNWLSGRMSDSEFQLALSKEWASVAMPNTNKSYYNQHVGTSDDELKQSLTDVKNAQCFG